MIQQEKKPKSALLIPTNQKRIAFFLLADTVLSLISIYSSYLLRFNFSIPDGFLAPFWTIALTLIALKIVFLYLFKNYAIIWRFYGFSDAKKLVLAHLVTYLLFSFILFSFPGFFAPFPRSIIIIDLLLSIILLGELRFIKRLVTDTNLSNHPLKPTLIVGISPNTLNLIKSSLEGSLEYYPMGIVAIAPQNYHMAGSYINNVKIYRKEELPELIDAKTISSAIIDGMFSDEILRETYRYLSDLGIPEIKRSSLVSEGHGAITDLSIEDLLARHPKDLSSETIETFIRGKSVLITGAGGSIGSEISLQCHRYGAQKLILVDHSEYNLYQIGEQIPSAKLCMCNIIDRESFEEIVKNARPDILIHAAAYKHVPLCEANVQSAIMNNVIGSRNVIDSAVANDVSKIVIISTDKAVRPTNVMGTTKRIVELYAQNVDPRNSEIVAVRFGNVLGSSGSVIPKFKAQIEAGGPITLTHPDITRYFMLIGEACQLVLQAAAIARGGELFILDMGESVKIADLANTMIRLYATQPIEIVYTGLRPGEKLYEELLIDESEQKTAFESIMIARSTPYEIERLNDDIEHLLNASDIRTALRRIVPEYSANSL